MGKPATKDNKSKGPAKKKEGVRLSALYDISGAKIERKNRTCPKCGPGMFMGKHKNRVVCGKCHYTEYTKKE